MLYYIQLRHSNWPWNVTSRFLSPFCIQQVAWLKGSLMQVVSYLGKLKFQNFNHTYQTNHNLTLRMRSANILVHWLYTHTAMHQYIDIGEFMYVSSKTKRAFGVNPFLLSCNKCRPHPYHLHHPHGRQKGQC